jgi:hypothetical protein
MRISSVLVGCFFLCGLALLGGMIWQVGLTGVLESFQALGPWIIP